MSATGGVFDEHLGVIAALKDNYMRREDALAVANVNSLREDLSQLCHAREDEVKNAIKQLSQDVDVAEARATYPNPPEAHEQRVQQLTEATTTARNGIENLNAQLRELEDARAEVKAQLAALQEKERHLEKLVDQVEPSIRADIVKFPVALLTGHKLSLYAHISKIVWDFERPERVMGLVDDPSRANISPFDLGEENTFDGVNQLWDIINGKNLNIK